jgi:VanZ family protein
MLQWKIFQYKGVAITWLIIMCILFFLPGSALPKAEWLDKINFDKIVHIGLFAVLIFLWRSSFNWKLKNYNLLLLCSAFLYGLMVEFIQLYWIPNRSFDLYDVAADMAGSILGLLIWIKLYKK